jgi:tetratricopeptide (TPR) repeat protein
MESKLNRFLLNQIFSLADFKKTYRELMKSSLTQVLYWPVYESEFESAQVNHEAFSAIRIAEFLMEATRSLLDYETLKSSIPSQGHLNRTRQFDDVLRTLPLSPEESFVASRLEMENMTLDTLNMLAGVPEDRIVRLLYALEKFGALQIHLPESKISRRAEASRLNVPAGSPPGPQFQSSPIHHSPSSGNPPVSPFESMQPKESKKQPTESSLRDEYLAELQKKRFQSPASQSSHAQEAQVRMEVQKSDKKIELEQHLKDAESLYLVAEQKYEEGFYYEATTLCRRAIANNPAEAKYYLLMAHAYSKHPRFVKDAEIAYQKAVDLDNWNVEYRLELAEFYVDQGLSMRAFNEVKKILQLNPQHARALELHKQIASKHR